MTTKKITPAQLDLLYLLAYPDAFIVDGYSPYVDRPGRYRVSSDVRKPTFKAVIASPWVENQGHFADRKVLSAAGVAELIAAGKFTSLEDFRKAIVEKEAAEKVAAARKLASTEIEIKVEDAYAGFYNRGRNNGLKSHRLSMGCLPNVSIEVIECSDWDTLGRRVNISINERDLRIDQMPHFNRLLARATEIATERERLIIWHESDNDYMWQGDTNVYPFEFEPKAGIIAPVEIPALVLDTDQKYLISLLANPNVQEATSDDDGRYWVNVKVNGQWEKKYWQPGQVQMLVDAGYLCQFPNRWNPKHQVVIIAKDRQTELFALAKRKAMQS